MQDMQDMIDRLNQSGKRLSKGHRKIAQYIVHDRQPPGGERGRERIHRRALCGGNGV